MLRQHRRTCGGKPIRVATRHDDVGARSGKLERREEADPRVGTRHEEPPTGEVGQLLRVPGIAYHETETRVPSAAPPRFRSRRAARTALCPFRHTLASGRPRGDHQSTGGSTRTGLRRKRRHTYGCTWWRTDVRNIHLFRRRFRRVRRRPHRLGGRARRLPVRLRQRGDQRRGRRRRARVQRGPARARVRGRLGLSSAPPSAHWQPAASPTASDASL